MNCQMFSTGLSSGDFGGSGIKVILLGTVELGRKVPAGLIEQQNTMGSRRHRSGDLGQMQSHGGGIAARQNKAGGDPFDSGRFRGQRHIYGGRMPSARTPSAMWTALLRTSPSSRIFPPAPRR